MTIEERIQELRKQKGLSQEQLAEALGISRQAVSKWESGQSMPEVEKLIAMSYLFEVTVDYILKGGAPRPSHIDDKRRRDTRLASQILSAVATMPILIGIVTSLWQFSNSTYTATTDLYLGLLIESFGVVMLLVGITLAGNRILNKPQFIINILLAGVLPSMMVPVSTLELKGITLKMSVETFYGTPGVFLLFTATYILLCGTIIYLTVIRRNKKRRSTP